LVADIVEVSEFMENQEIRNAVVAGVSTDAAEEIKRLTRENTERVTELGAKPSTGTVGDSKLTDIGASTPSPRPQTTSTRPN